jgi:sugar lactone lactonase YvrE
MSVSKPTVLLTIALAFLAAACGSDDKTASSFPAALKVQETGFYPEGIAYSERHHLIYLGSFYRGKVATLDAQGTLRPFIDDPRLVSVVGLAVDEANNRLVVTNSDMGRGERSSAKTTFQLAEIVTYDLDTGARIHATNLAELYRGGQFVNDVVTDGKGTIYATNSASPVIYKVDASGTGSVLVEHELLAPPAVGQFGTNGIVYHPDGYLIVSKGAGLLKVPLDNPKNISAVTVDQSLNAIDGLLLTDNHTLVVVSNNFTGQPYPEAVYELGSKDGWKTARVSATFTALEDKMPTTATLVGKDVYVTHANFMTLEAFFGNHGALASSFVVQKVSF